MAPPVNHNGSPDTCPHESGIIELRTSVGEMRSDIHIIKTALVGSIETGEPGIMDKIRSLETARRADEAAKRKWMGVAFAAIGAFATAAGAGLWQILTGKGSQ